MNFNFMMSFRYFVCNFLKNVFVCSDLDEVNVTQNELGCIRVVIGNSAVGFVASLSVILAVIMIFV